MTVVKTQEVLSSENLPESSETPSARTVFKIYADMREQRSGVVKALQDMENIEVVIGELPCGDYVLSPEVAVERKSATDFVLSVMSGRVFEQVGRMKLDFVRPVVMIEGNPYKTRSKIEASSIAGAISALVTVQKVSVVPTGDVKETALMLATMARHLQEGLGYELVLHPKKPPATRDAALYVISSLPGVGVTTASKLYDHFGSIHAVMTSSMEGFLDVKGIGKKTAERIYNLIHHC